MLENPIITLTTDFGLKDPFVGIMKGVILTINPKAEVIDLSHNISPHNVYEAAHVLSMACEYFPKTTIHVAVVDPEVGSKRRPLLVVTEDYYFIGPDNGIFTPFFNEQSSIFKVIHITSSHYYLPVKGPTFHGRDIFAPVAAWLSRGIESYKFGDVIYDYVRLPLPKPKMLNETTIEGIVVHIDNFGNAITNIKKDDLEKLTTFSNDRLKVFYKDRELSLVDYYAQVETSMLSAIINSFGSLELFTYRGNAAKEFDIKIGDKVSVSII
jgi:hypothetical protein